MPILGSRGAASASGFGGIGGGAATAIICATGGDDVSVCGDYRIHTFTSPGTFAVNSVEACTPGVVDYLVVAGGGGSAGDSRPGGSGAGGFRESQHPSAAPAWTASPLKSTTGITVSATPGSYPITVGAGGTLNPSSSTPSNPGGTSTFGPINSTGGGGGAHGSSAATTPPFHGQPGGSGSAAGQGAAPASANWIAGGYSGGGKNVTEEFTGETTSLNVKTLTQG